MKRIARSLSIERSRALLIPAVVLAAFMVAGCATTEHVRRARGADIRSPAGISPPGPGTGGRRVAAVIDGDTLVLDSGEKVRLIGVDAPESVHPEIPVQRFGEEAEEFLRRLAEGFECTLEYERPGSRDRYGRLLAYVYVGGRMLNEEILRNGYAYVYTVFPFGRQERFEALEREARWKQAGLWSLSLKDGRIANLVTRYESLNAAGRVRLDQVFDELAEQYPAASSSNTAAAVVVDGPVADAQVRAVQAVDGIPVISWRDASRYVGQKVVVEGTITVTHKADSACFLNFHADYAKHFFAVIFASAFSRFPARPEVFYKGKDVRISGVVGTYEGRPQIILLTPDQVEIVN